MYSWKEVLQSQMLLITVVIILPLSLSVSFGLSFSLSPLDVREKLMLSHHGAASEVSFSCRYKKKKLWGNTTCNRFFLELMSILSSVWGKKENDD